MNVQDIIQKKRDAHELSDEEIEFLIKGISEGSVPDYQVSAWAMAVYFQGMTARETRSLALSMAYSGETMDLSAIEGIKVDKHSTGGVGDKTTMIVIPLVAALGVPAAKMSGRGLGHTGGTIDKFESIPGFQVEKAYSDFVDQVNRVKAAVVSQTGNLVPADKRLYAIRDVTATVDSIPLIASSVMSKKIAAGADAIVLDVKVGSGAFMKDKSEAEKLARTMVEIGSGAGREVIAMITDMSQPLGMTVGNALEVREAIDTLKGQGPADLEELSVMLAAQMAYLAKKCASLDEAEKLVREVLKSGAGLDKFCEIVAAQKGILDLESKGYGLPQASIQEELICAEEGYIAQVDALEIGRTAMLLGAGRERKEDSIDPAVGIELLKKRGDYVKAGEAIAIIHGNDAKKVELALKHIITSYSFSQQAPAKIDTVLGCIDS